MNHRYAHIMTPLPLGRYILKNRIINSKSMPDVGDPAGYPNEHQIEFAARYARNGASMVTCQPGEFREMKGRTFFTSRYDMENRDCQGMFTKMIERIHAYGSLASAATMIYLPVDVSISDIHDWSQIPDEFPPGPEGIYAMPGMGESRDKVVPPEITKEQIREFIDLFAEYCYKLKCVGFDMVNIYASYNASILAKSLSPILNQRTDEYGGSVENRARLLCELLAKIKEICGKDYPIELQISGEETLKGGYSTEDFVAYCKLFEPYVDIFQIRAKSGDLTHVNAYFFEKECPPNLRYCKLLKDAGIKSYIAPVGGFQDPAVMERVLSEGLCDLIAQARALICEEDYWTKIVEDRADEITSCLGCDKCHQGVCAINPRIGNPGWKDMIQPPVRVKKVAVIGGGPAGLRAAWTAAERGHQVDLYEKSGRLGGQLIHCDYIDKKWSMKGFKDHLIRMCEKYGVNFLLNTEATPELLEGKDYDAVIAAPGSRFRTDAVPVEAGASPMDVMTLFGKEAELGRHVVIVGGSMTAVDAALYLLQSGHQVTVLTRSRQAGHDYDRHSRDGFFAMWNSLDGLSTIAGAQATLIREKQVVYRTRDGQEKTVDCDSVVLSEGRIPLTEEAKRFIAPGRQFYVAGDASQIIDTTSARMPMSMPGMPPQPRKDPNPVTTENGIRHSQLTAFWAANSL